MAREATDGALDIVKLRDADRDLVSTRLGKRAPNALTLLDRLFEHPVVSARSVERMVDVSQPTASALVRDLERLEILHEITGRQRNRLFSYDRYIELFPGATDRG